MTQSEYYWQGRSWNNSHPGHYSNQKTTGIAVASNILYFVPEKNEGNDYQCSNQNTGTDNEMLTGTRESSGNPSS